MGYMYDEDDEPTVWYDVNKATSLLEKTIQLTTAILEGSPGINGDIDDAAAVRLTEALQELRSAHKRMVDLLADARKQSIDEEYTIGAP